MGDSVLGSFSIWHLLIVAIPVAALVFLVILVIKSGKKASYTEKPLSRVAGWLKIFMGLTAMFMLAAIALYLRELNLLLGGSLAEDAQLDAINQNISQLQLITPFMAICVIVASLLGFWWIYRASANLWARKIPDMSFSPGGAIGFYFVPILSLFLPYLAMKEICRKSADIALPSPQPAAWVLGLWWFLFVASWIAKLATNMLARQAETIDQLLPLNIASLVELILGLALIACFYVIIARVTQAQGRLAVHSSSR
jgi:hypothetical protein